jgi:16S rRNA (cytidine1402-2'-O)-methyltransferase
MMGSGMNGQNFAFVGYLPIEKSERRSRIKELERLSKRTGQTQIFIETPYRNDKLFKELIQTLTPRTRVCRAVNLTSQQAQIETRSVAEWRVGTPDIGKVPTIFLLDSREEHRL